MNTYSDYSNGLCNIFRHGAINPLNPYSASQTRLLFLNALHAQASLDLPLRFVSHNLVNHMLQIYDGEWKMMTSQMDVMSQSFTEAFNEYRTHLNEERERDGDGEGEGNGEREG